MPAEIQSMIDYAASKDVIVVESTYRLEVPGSLTADAAAIDGNCGTIIQRIALVRGRPPPLRR